MFQRSQKKNLMFMNTVNDRVLEFQEAGHSFVSVQEAKLQVQSQKNPVIDRLQINPENSHLILSVFSGIDLLGRGFKENGFCVVQAGDIILDNDIRHFHPPKGKFEGVVGGPPCQDFSKLNRNEPTGYGLEMLSEFKRVVLEADCTWFLMENVPTVPDIFIEGYLIQRFALSPNEIGYPQSRKRHFQFGSKQGNQLVFQRSRYEGKTEPCLTASEGRRQERRGFEDFCYLQGLNYVPHLPDLTKAGRYKVIGNAVHLQVAKVVAKAICESTYNYNRRYGTAFKLCICGCGEILTGNQKMKNSTCRKRMQMKREYAAMKESKK